jgi:hypothetical protein
MNSVDFARIYYQCRDLLPDEKTRSTFDAALVGGLSVYLPEEKLRFVMGVALDSAQSFHQPRLQLVKR